MEWKINSSRLDAFERSKGCSVTDLEHVVKVCLLALSCVQIHYADSLCSGDTTRIRAELAEMRELLEKNLTMLAVHGQAVQIPSAPSPPTPPPPPPPTDPVISPQPLEDLVRRLERALRSGGKVGPRGERLATNLRRLNASTAAMIGREVSLESGKADSIESLVSRVNELSAAQVAAPGLYSEESAKKAFNVANAFQDLADYANALHYFHLALRARECVLGASHPTTLNTLDKIAAVFEIQSDWENALPYYQLSCDERSSSPAIGTGHPSYLHIATRVACMLGKTGETQRALEEFKSILTRLQSQPNGGGATALAVRSEAVQLRLQTQKSEEHCSEAKAVLDEYRTLHRARCDSRVLGPRHHLTLEAESAIRNLEAAISQTQSPELEPGPLPAPASPMNDGPSVTGIAELDELERLISTQRKLRGERDPQILDRMCDLAEAYARHEKYENAVAWYLEALKGRELVQGHSHPRTLTTVHDLGETYAAQGKYRKALESFQRALDGRRSKLGESHDHTLDTLLEIGITHKRLGEYTQARMHIEKCRAAWTAKHGTDHESTLRTTFQLAQVQFAIKSSSQAIDLHQQVLDARKRLHGNDHILVFKSLYALGSVFRQHEEYNKAIPLLVQSYNGNRTAFGPYHFFTRNVASDLATMCWKTSRYAEAVEYYTIVSKGIERARKKDSLDGVATMSNIALCYMKLEEFQKAIDWYVKVLTQHETVLGDTDDRTIEAVDDLALACMKAENFDDALQHYDRVYRAREGRNADEDLAFTVYQLAVATFKLKQFERSLYWSQIHAGFGQIGSLEGRLATRRRIALILAHNNEDDEALTMYEDLLLEVKQALTHGHWLTATVEKEWTDLYVKILGKNETAQDLQRLMEAIKRRLSRNEVEGVFMLHKIGNVYAKQSKPAEALAVLEEALEAINFFEWTDELKALKNETISDIADQHIALCNSCPALKSLQELLDGDDADQYKLGALFRRGNVYQELGDYAQAITAYESGLAEEERTVGAESSAALATVRSLAVLHLNNHDPAKALPLTQRALSAYRRKPDSESRQPLFSTLETLSSVHLMQGNLQLAVNAQRDAAVGLERESGPGDQRTISAAKNLADLLKMMDNDDEALEWYRKVVQWYKDGLGVGSVDADDVESKIREIEGDGR